MDEPEALRLQLKEDDEEGRMIQESGVDSIVYGPELWADRPALLGLMREDNLDAEIQRAETELDAFGHACQLLSDLLDGCGPQGTTITIDAVMEHLADMGFQCWNTYVDDVFIHRELVLLQYLALGSREDSGGC